MDLTIIAAVGVVAIVAVAAVSRRIEVAAPLSLVVVGIALSFLPGLPEIQVDPNWILAGALPPLLYAAAVRIPAQDFRRDFKAIAGLAVLLVVLTTVCSGLLFNTAILGLGLASAFALGAIISPTDAVAATSVGRRLGLPSRLLTILEGEGLVNDASSLVLLSSAVAATTVTVHLWKVGLDFVYAVARRPLRWLVYLPHPHPRPARSRPSAGRIPAVLGPRGPGRPLTAAAGTVSRSQGTTSRRGCLTLRNSRTPYCDIASTASKIMKEYAATRFTRMTSESWFAPDPKAPLSGFRWKVNNFRTLPTRPGMSGYVVRASRRRLGDPAGISWVQRRASRAFMNGVRVEERWPYMPRQLWRCP